MNNYKTFWYYFKIQLKILLFFILLYWLCSCNSAKVNTIELIRQCNDSIGFYHEQLMKLRYPIDSIRDDYVDKYPAKAFGFKEQENKKRFEYKADESRAYHAMLIETSDLMHKILPREIYLETKIMFFKSKLDSLKLELEK